MAKLRGELPIHRHCLDQSPLSHALRHRGEPSSTMVQFRASVFHVASSAFYPWMANSELAPQPVAFYAAVFFLVNATYICLSWELIDRIPVDQVSLTVRKITRFRSITTLCLFGVASVVALKYPLAGLGICICCLIAYLKPDPPVAGKPISPE